MRKALIGLIGLSISVGAHAQDADVTEYAAAQSSERVMTECLSQADLGHGKLLGCVGVIANPCLENAVSTREILDCTAQETEFWDRRLNVAYKELRAVYAEQDVEDDFSIINLAPMLQTTQRKWIEWRDTKCTYFELNRFRGGTLGRVAAADCAMSMTAERVDELEELLDEARM
ncbi:MAG: DUF1311 domain-containing protein [Henriciella sp.]|nr:DUF1311 domain-containing protein [Henriciella sp.]